MLGVETDLQPAAVLSDLARGFHDGGQKLMALDMARCGNRKDKENWAILKHRKGAPLQRENYGLDTLIFPAMSTLSPL